MEKKMYLIMKKAMYLMLLPLIALAASCSNDEIVVVKGKSLTYNVSTQPAFDKMNVTASYKSNFLGDGNSYQIGVYTFIYDQEGNLAASDSTYTKTFANVQQSFDLPSGKYTAITLEMLVDADDGYKSDYWMIAGKDKMSSLEVVRTAGWVYYGGVVAVSTENISVDGDKSIEVTPSPLGAIVQVNFHNFDQSDYTYVALFTKDEPVGRYLSPSLSGTERFHYGDYLGRNIWSSRGYDYEESGLDSNKGLTIYLIEEGKIQYGLAPSTVTDGEVNKFYLYPDNGNAYLTVEDGSRYCGGLWYTGNGGKNDCEGFAGTESEYETWLSETDRTVSKGDFSYKAPYIQWGSSVSSVQSYMSGYTMTEGKSGTAIAQSDNSYIIRYSGKDNESAIEYYFSSATTGLYESDLYFDKTEYSLADINASMSGQTALGEYEGAYMYVSSDAKSYIVVMQSGDYNVIGFVDVNHFTSSSAMPRNGKGVKTSKAVELIRAMRHIAK